MDRLSVFYPAKNDAGYVQAVIVESDLVVYQELGFVTSIDDLKKPETEEAAEDKVTTASKPDKKAKSNGDDTDKG